MKRQTKRRIMALVMAALMVVGLIPTGFAAKAVSANTVSNHIDVTQGLKAGTVYGDESIVKVEVLEDMNFKEAAKTVDGVEYKGFVQGTKNASPKGGDIPTEGAAFKITAAVDSTITFVTKDAAKTYHFVNEADKSDVTGTSIPLGSLKFELKAGNTYYFYADGSKACVYDIIYAYEKAASDYYKESISVENGLKAGTVYGKDTAVTFEVLEDMNFKETAKTVDGVEYKGFVQGTKNASPKGGDIPTEGAAFKITAAVDSTITFVTKDAAKTYHFVNEADKSDVTGTSIPLGSLKFELKAGNTYYFYADGSKVCVFGITIEAGTPELDWSAVAAPELGTPTQDGDSIVVPYTAVIGDNGGEALNVYMYQGDTLIDSTVTKATGSSGSVKFKPSSTGDYTFKATLSRDGKEDKVSKSVEMKGYVLPLTAPTNLFATNKGNGSILVEWDPVSEADSYDVSYSLDGSTFTKAGTTDKTSLLVNGLTVGKEYTFNIVANRKNPETVSEAGVIKAEVTKEAQAKWGAITYGNGASAEKDQITGSAYDGKVTIKSKSGKLVPASFDGVSFYYTEVPASQNFTLRAKVTVDSWTLSNGQEGFGLMAADKLGGSGWNNSYMAVASKTEYYWNEEAKEVTTDSSATKISQKLGLASQEKTGVTKDNIAAIEANDTATVQANFKSTSYPLEQRYPEAKNIIGNSTNTPADAGDITEMYLTIQKNNTGYFVTYESVDGSYSTTKKYYDTEALERIDSDYVYAGFFASRNATATFSDITFTTVDPKEDAPAEERPIEKVAVNTYVQSATATGSADYEFLFSANCDGTLSIEDAKGEVVVSDVEVKADTLVKPASVTLNKGKNAYKINFTPAEGYKPNGEYSAMESYETVVIDHTVTYKTFGEAGQSIWVAPDAKGSGSKEDPMSIYDAVKYVMPSQQIVLTEGTYKLESPLKIARGINGTADQMIYMVADPDAKTRPVIDFQGLCTGMTIGGDYWYFKGFDVTGSADGQKGLQVSGSHNTLDQIETYHNGNTGLQISRLNVTDTYAEWPSYNLILNCTSYGNADKGYEDADGFAAKLTVGDGNVFDGCIAHHNADDGWDLFAKVQTGSIGSVTIKNSIAYANGYLEDGTNAGNGNGFKMGGDSMPGSHVLENSIAFANKAKGIDSNSCPDIKVKNCTSINNQGANVAFYTNSAKNTDFEATGVISFRTAKEDVAENIKPVGSQDLTKIYKATNFYWDTASKTSFNTPAAGEAVTTVSADWFASLDYSSILDGNKSVAGIVRNADGTIALGNIFKLTDKAPAGVGADFSIEKLTKSSNPTIGTPVPTGDKANTALYVVLIVLSVLALGGVCFYEVKRKKNRVK